VESFSEFLGKYEGHYITGSIGLITMNDRSELRWLLWEYAPGCRVECVM